MTRRFGFVALSAFVFFGCSAPAASSSSSKRSGKDAAVTPSAENPPEEEEHPVEEDAGAPEQPDATVSDSAAPPSDAGGDASDGNADANVPDANISTNLAVTAATARNIGRRGESIRVTVDGTDKSKQTTSVVVRLLDASGSALTLFDTNFDGVADATAKRFRFETSSLGKSPLSGAFTIPNVYVPGLSTIAKVGVSLEDAAGAHSPEMIALLTEQAVKQEYDPCDVTKVADRCIDGYSCSGSPATCKVGVAPQQTKIAYYGGAQPRMLFRGTEPDDDLGSFAIEFLDSAGNPKAVDLIDDGTMSTGFTIDATGLAENGGFFMMNLPASGFDVKVPKFASTPSDKQGHNGTRLVTAISSIPVRASGQACDYQGFDACAAGTVCSPGLASSTNTCASQATLRTTKCSAATVLDPSKGITQAFGKVEGVSLWDAPNGCVTNDATGRPEAILKLHLATLAPTLVLTTALPETDFDTSIYLLSTCASAGTTALGCNDDTIGSSSTLTLTNVAAGDYIVAVDSVSARGGRFGISVSVK